MSRFTLLLMIAACSSPEFDGRYRVDSYTFDDSSSCEGAGEEVIRTFDVFEIRERSLFGVTIYPVYPCDETGACAVDNDANWNLVVVEDDLGNVGAEFTMNEGNTCVMTSRDLVIDAWPEGGVRLRSLDYQLVIPYDPNTCTPENAAANRGRMECATVLQLVGVPD